MKSIKNGKISAITFVLVLIVLMVAVILLEEGVRSIVYSSGFHPKIQVNNGVNYFISEQYTEWKGGYAASKYLPSYDNLSNANYIDFQYIDYSPCETLFVNYGTSICLGVQYNEDYYLEEKERILKEGIAFGKQTVCSIVSESRLLTKEKVSFNQYLYYLIALSDETHSVVYIVCYDDKEYDYLLHLDRTMAFSFTDFWAHFFPNDEMT